MNRTTISLVALIGAVAGCTSVDATNTAHHDFSADRTFYIVEVPKSDVHLAIRMALVAHGYDATTGLAGRVPAGTDVVVTYVPYRAFDSGNLLTELDLTFLQPGTDRVLASGKSSHPSVRASDPQAMAAEVIDKLLAEGK